MSLLFSRLLPVLCSLFSCLCPVAWSQTALDPTEIASLRDFISTTMACKNVTGLTIAMVRNGETVFADGFGHTRKGNDAPVTNETLFNIASITRSFTAAIAAHAVGYTHALWDTPLKSMLGDDFWLQDQFRTEQISLRDILSNKAGIPSYWGVSTAALNVSREELVRRMRYFQDAKKFRSGWLYSNYMYVLAGYVTEALTGQTWEEAVKSIIFDKLGMNSSRVSAEMEDDDWANTCWSRIESEGDWIEVDEPGQVSILDEIGPAAGIYSNAVDMAEYAKFHLNFGKNPAGEEVVHGVALQDTYAPTFATATTCCLHRPTYPIDDTSNTYGMGWFQGSYRGFRKVFHTGSYSGYYCRLTLFHGQNSGVFVCVNSPGDNRGYDAVYAVSMYASDLLLGLAPWLDTNTGCTYPNPWREPARTYPPQRAMTYSPYLPLRPLADYVGDYGNYAFGNFSITYDEEERILRYSFGKLLHGTLSPHHILDTTLYMRIEGAVSYREYFYSTYNPYGWAVDFGTDKDGNIIDLTVPYFEYTYTPVFTKGVKMDDAPEAQSYCGVSRAPSTVHLTEILVYISCFIAGTLI